MSVPSVASLVVSVSLLVKGSTSPIPKEINSPLYLDNSSRHTFQEIGRPNRRELRQHSKIERFGDDALHNVKKAEWFSSDLFSNKAVRIGVRLLPHFLVAI